ncbi:MAG: DUF4864 domain-containing protein [Geminicoccaceae bacterium]|nr:MAG: DUF4864 domain-containing protein [Geminicoccaceae bacterium]
MRALLFALALAFATSSWASPSLAVDLAAEDTAAIRAVVQSQLDAFQRDDKDAAFAYASPTIQDLFRTADVFMAMVRAGYQPVYRPQTVSFQDIVTFRGAPTQRVLLVGPDGLAVMAYYLMERQRDGTWRIAGCILEPIADAQA